MKYTAIEWLVEQLEGDDAIIARVIGLKKYNEIYKKAKEMEKQQIIDACYYGHLKEMEKQQIIDACYYGHLKGWVDNGIENSYAEQYYKDTFKN